MWGAAQLPEFSRVTGEDERHEWLALRKRQNFLAVIVAKKG